MLRVLAAVMALALLAGCGGKEPDAADLNRTNEAPEAVFLQRVLGDDPVSESVSLRVDGTAAVRRGAARGYWDLAIELSPAEAERTLAHARGAPFAALAGRVIPPGGFYGDDNERRYMLRRGDETVTAAESDLPPRMRTLVHDLNALIDGDLGRIVADDRHYSAAGVTGSDASDDDQAPPVYENSPATPVRSGGDMPRPDRTLACYGSGGRQYGPPAAGLRVGPVVVERPGRDGHAAVVLQPGAVATLAITPRTRAGLLYGVAWRRPHALADADRVVRFEGCSDTTGGAGGVARFEGGILARGCARLTVHAGGETGRRRVGCR